MFGCNGCPAKSSDQLPALLQQDVEPRSGGRRAGRPGVCVQSQGHCPGQLQEGHVLRQPHLQRGEDLPDPGTGMPCIASPWQTLCLTAAATA